MNATTYTPEDLVGSLNQGGIGLMDGVAILYRQSLGFHPSEGLLRAAYTKLDRERNEPANDGLNEIRRFLILASE